MSPLPLPVTPPWMAHWAGAPFHALTPTPALIALATQDDWHTWRAAQAKHGPDHWLVLGPPLTRNGHWPTDAPHRLGIYTCPDAGYQPRLPLPYHPGGLESLRRLSLRAPGRTFLLTDVAGITDGPLWADLAHSLGVQLLIAGAPEQAEALWRQWADPR